MGKMKALFEEVNSFIGLEKIEPLPYVYGKDGQVYLEDNFLGLMFMQKNYPNENKEVIYIDNGMRGQIAVFNTGHLDLQPSDLKNPLKEC